jgi:poly(3-hydroxybutyrate) depolymerase
MPILYFLHGLGDNITRLDNEFHFQQVADEFQWAVVIPQALSQSGATMWNAGLMASSIDDSGFLMALLDALAEQYPINLDSVFFTGFSMGGFMTHRMAIEHGDRITACAPVSGLITHSMANQTAVAPVRMLHIHGTTDPVVGYDGNSQYFGGNLGLSVDAILDYWKNANHCVAEPVIDTFPDLKNDGLRFVRYTYEGEAELQHIKVIGGNHTWYMSENQYDIGYLTEIHKFFTINNGYVDVTEHNQNTLQLWPNPTSGCVTIKVEDDTVVEVMDVQGRCMAKYALKSGTQQIELRDLTEGLYFIKGENGSVTKVMLTK